MSGHRGYSRIRVDDPCFPGGLTPALDVGEGHEYEAEFVSEQQVDIQCNRCHTTVARYHRHPEVDEQPVPADKSLKRTTIKFKRHIGWVGYAHNPMTVGLAYPMLEHQALDLFFAYLKEHGLGPNDEQKESITRSLMFGIPRTYNPSPDDYWAMRGAFRQLQKHALYYHRREAYRKDTGVRGLWFSDPHPPLEGSVEEIVTCQTGKRGIGGQYGDELEPNYLYDTRVHRLYGVGYGYPKYLVHPSDVIGEE